MVRSTWTWLNLIATKHSNALGCLLSIAIFMMLGCDASPGQNTVSFAEPQSVGVTPSQAAIAADNPQQAEESSLDLFADCINRDTIPADLRKSYASLVSAMRQGEVLALRKDEIAPFCLPTSIQIVENAHRPKETDEYGTMGEMNLAFLQSRFQSQVISCEKISEDSFQIRTGTSLLCFVSTKSGRWFIYQYFDKPIQ